jgi:acetylornithine deacetylase/succinyl-diaminopimelate desuccinylase-like protein
MRRHPAAARANSPARAAAPPEGGSAITASELLEELVRVPSVNPTLDPTSPGEAALASLVADYLRAHGIPVRLDEGVPGRPGVVAALGEPSRDRPALLLACHLDTVPAGGMPEPFAPRRLGGALYARGACDVKAGLAAMLAALPRFRRASRPLVFWGTVDEEADFQGVRALASRGLHAVGAVVAEPTRLRPVVAHKGALRLDLWVAGRAAHSARPELGENAIRLAWELAHDLEAGFADAFGAAEHPLCGRSAWSVTQVATDNPVNVIPGLCRLGVDVRLAPGLPPEAVLAWLDRRLQAFPATVWRSVRQVDPALDTPPSAPVVRWAVEATGVPPEGAPYGTDASKIAALAGIPSVVLGPGDIAWAHTAEEHVDLAEVERAAEVYAEVVARFLASD